MDGKVEMSRVDKIASTIRQRIRMRVRNHHQMNVALALSGGVDSCSILAATMGATLLAQPHLQGHWKTPTGLYAAMARGEV